MALIGLNRAALDDLAALAPERCAVYTPVVSDAAAMAAVGADWLARFGAPDLVIANAGVAGGFDTARPDDLRVMRRMLEINLLGVATSFSPFLGAMQAAGRPAALVGVASIAGWRGMPGNGAYCASKAGLIAYLQSLRAELRPTPDGAHRSPGYLRTPLTAGNRFAMPGLLGPARPGGPPAAGVARGTEHIVLPRRGGWLAPALLPDKLHDKIPLRQPQAARGEPGSTDIPGLK